MSDDIRAAQAELNDRVLGREGVTGTAIGLDNGAPCLKVYVADKGKGSGIPRKVKGFPVVVEATGSFRRL